jgi:predicted ATPase
VGRQSANAVLDGCLQKALNGHRQMIFVTGEAGIGKTALVDEFYRRASVTPNLRIARGQCVEGFGGKEAYYSVLEALNQLLRGPDRGRVIQNLIDRAPTWVVQFPDVVKSDQRAALQQEVLGSTQERMLRELCDALDALAEHDPVVLILEDIHWVDASTVDLLSALARRRGKAKLVVVCTLRPSETGILDGLRLLKQELLAHQLCYEVRLEALEESDVTAFLKWKFPGGNLPLELSGLVLRNSGGNALFMTALVQELVNREMTVIIDGEWVVTKPISEIAQIIPGPYSKCLRFSSDN